METATCSTSRRSSSPFDPSRIRRPPSLASDEETARWRAERAAEHRARLIAASGIPPRFRGLPASAMRPEVARWAASARDRDGGAGNLVLSGPAGCGKTTQACAALAEVAGSRPVLFATFGDVLRAVRATYGRAGSEEEALGAYRSAGVLCIDDLGKERPTADALEKLFALVDYRYSRLKATIYTTQYGQQALGRRLMAEGGDYEQASAILRRVYQGAASVALGKEER